MPARTKVINLDGNGAGSVHIDPLWYAGGEGFTNSQSNGIDLGGTVPLTFGNMKPVRGGIDVQGGSANGRAVIYAFEV